MTEKISAEDRRSVDILITQKGLDLLAELDKQLPDFERSFTNLTEEEAQQLNGLLDKLRG